VTGLDLHALSAMVGRELPVFSLVVPFWVVAALAGLFMGCSAREMVRTYAGTLKRVRVSLLTIAAMLALGYVSRYSGTDATLGLALARTGAFYPFCGTLLGPALHNRTRCIEELM
jgi:L-lactate permease